MCVDFADLNKHCPKDPYPLPRIDKLVDIATGCEVMSMLDCFLGYHQIWLNPEDEEKTSFIVLGWDVLLSANARRPVKCGTNFF